MLGNELNSSCIPSLVYSLQIPQLAARESTSQLVQIGLSPSVWSSQIDAAPLHWEQRERQRGMEASLLCFGKRDYKRRQEAGDVMLAAREKGDQMPALA